MVMGTEWRGEGMHHIGALVVWWCGYAGVRVGVGDWTKYQTIPNKYTCNMTIQ